MFETARLDSRSSVSGYRERSTYSVTHLQDAIRDLDKEDALAAVATAEAVRYTIDATPCDP
jgi:hypothetical protein